MESKLRILHLEDNQNDAELIKEKINNNGINAEIDCIVSKEDYITGIESGNYDLILSDYSLPNYNGLMALIETQKRNIKTPFIFVSGTIGEERAIQCLQLGALDYVLKDKLERLSAAINRALKIIEETKQKEIAVNNLKEREEFFSLVLNEMSDSVSVINFNGNIVFANNAFLKMMGINDNTKKEDLNYYEIIPFSEHEVLKIFNYSQNKTESLLINEKLIKNKNNNEILIDITYRIVNYKNERLILIVIRDITEKKKSIKEISMLKQAMDNSGDVIYITNTEGKFIYVNLAFTKTYGWKPDEILNIKDFKILWSDETESKLYNELWEKVKEDKTYQLELIYKTKYGNTVEVQDTLSIVYDLKNNIQGYLSIQADISIIKNAERQLKIGKDKAEEMNKLKSYFLSNLSHELRTPLISIIGFSEILHSEIENKDQLELLNHINEGGLRLQNTLNSIMELSKIEIEDYKISYNNCNINDELIKIVDSKREVAERKRIYLDFKTDNQIINGQLDLDIFHKVIDNILTNSIKFTKIGGVQVKSELRKNGNSSVAVIEVIDTGIGISPENQKLIFEPFRQGSEGLSRNYEGLGLGLTLSKKMVELLKGQILVESKINEGSKFTVILPVNPSDKEIEKEVKSIRKNTKIFFRRNKAELPPVLLVEDSEANRIVTSLFLKGICSIDEAIDGISALAKVKDNLYSLILMDINLGKGIDGVETINRIRKLNEYKDIPSIAITAYAMPGDRSKYINSGFNEYLSKPFLKKDLINLVEKYVLTK